MARFGPPHKKKKWTNILTRSSFCNSKITCTCQTEILSLAVTLLRPLVPCLSQARIEVNPEPVQLYLTVYLGQNFTPNIGTEHILWTKLGDETAARSCPKATFCSAVLALGFCFHILIFYWVKNQVQ